MPLYIRDDSVNVLASQLQQMMHAANKTEAVREALQNEIARLSQQGPLCDRVAIIQRNRREKNGHHRVDFDMKSFTDEGWDH